LPCRHYLVASCRQWWALHYVPAAHTFWGPLRAGLATFGVQLPAVNLSGQEVQACRPAFRPQVSKEVTERINVKDQYEFREPAETARANRDVLAKLLRCRRHDPQHFLNFFPLPHGHGSFRPTLFLPTLPGDDFPAPYPSTQRYKSLPFGASSSRSVDPQRGKARDARPRAINVRSFGHSSPCSASRSTFRSSKVELTKTRKVQVAIGMALV